MPFGVGPCKCCDPCPPFFTEGFGRPDGGLGSRWTVDAGEWSIDAGVARTSSPHAMARYTGRSLSAGESYNFRLELSVFGETEDVSRVYFFQRTSTAGLMTMRVELDYGAGLVSVVATTSGVETVRRVVSADLTPRAWQRLKVCRASSSNFEPDGVSIFLADELLFNFPIVPWSDWYDGAIGYLGLGAGAIAEDVRFDRLRLGASGTFAPDSPFNPNACPYCTACLWPRLAGPDDHHNATLLITGGDLSFSSVSTGYASPRVYSGVNPRGYQVCGYHAVGGPYSTVGLGSHARFMRVYARPASDTTVELVCDVYYPGSFAGDEIGAVYLQTFDMTIPDALLGAGPYTLTFWPGPTPPGMTATLDVELIT